MWYYGRSSDKWANDQKAQLPTGVCGYAESPDGLHWTRVKGPLSRGAVLEPSSEGPDSVHLGVSDILEGAGDLLGMLYFGATDDEGPVLLPGMRMKVFSAASTDGLNWEKRPGTILEPGGAGEWDTNFASWARVVPIDAERPEGPWLLHYHSLESAKPPRWAAGVAVCQCGEEALTGPYEKLGRVLSGGEPGSWDECGIGTRHVLHHDGALWMVYEGVSAMGTHAIGVARSDDGGRTWEKQSVDEPVFAPRSGEAAWDRGNVGTPYVVRLPGGGFRMYYLGVGRGESNSVQFAFGAAESDGDTLLRWRRVAQLEH